MWKFISALWGRRSRPFFAATGSACALWDGATGVEGPLATRRERKRERRREREREEKNG
jgi:hypothetical protein